MIKEFCLDSKIAIIREDRYGSSLEKFIRLFHEALKDFPDLATEDVTIVHYGGQRYAKTFGIEFYASNAPDTYIRISELELTR